MNKPLFRKLVWLVYYRTLATGILKDVLLQVMLQFILLCWYLWLIWCLLSWCGLSYIIYAIDCSGWSRLNQHSIHFPRFHLFSLLLIFGFLLSIKGQCLKHNGHVIVIFPLWNYIKEYEIVKLKGIFSNRLCWLILYCCWSPDFHLMAKILK